MHFILCGFIVNFCSFIVKTTVTRDSKILNRWWWGKSGLKYNPLKLRNRPTFTEPNRFSSVKSHFSHCQQLYSHHPRTNLWELNQHVPRAGPAPGGTKSKRQLPPLSRPLSQQCFAALGWLRNDVSFASQHLALSPEVGKLPRRRGNNKFPCLAYFLKSDEIPLRCWGCTAQLTLTLLWNAFSHR